MNVNLIGGTPDAPALHGGIGQESVIPSRPSFTAQLTEEAAHLAEQFNNTADRLNLLLSDENRVAMSRTLKHLEQVTAVLANESTALVETLEDLRQTARQTRIAGAELPGTVTQFRQSAAALEKMANEIAGAGNALRGQVEASGGEVRRFMGETLPEASAVVDELRETAASLRRASETLERDPSVLLYGATPPQPGPGE
jgi:phospholipid/cholesterol/gamma-HCH transport system substrate-binding protein